MKGETNGNGKQSRCNWPEVFDDLSKRGWVKFEELQETTGKKPIYLDRTLRAYARTNGQVVEINDDKVRVRSGADAVEQIFSNLTAHQKTAAYKRIRLDDHIAAKTKKEWKEGTVADNVSDGLYECEKYLQGLVQNHKGNAGFLSRASADVLEEINGVYRSVRSHLETIGDLIETAMENKK